MHVHVVSCLIGCFEAQCRLPDNYSKEGDVVKAEDVTLSWYASPHYTEQLVISWSQPQPGEEYDTDNVCVCVCMVMVTVFSGIMLRISRNNCPNLGYSVNAIPLGTCEKA